MNNCHSEPEYRPYATNRITKELQHMKRHGWSVLITPECGVMATFVVGEETCTVKLTFTPDYPGTPVAIVLTEPFAYVFPSVHVDEQLGDWLMDDILVLTTDLLDRRAEMAGRLPSITGVAYLVLGANPYEARRGRVHYDDPHVFFLDNQAISSHPRLISADFSSPVEMGILSSLLPSTFDEICFDESTFKFFNSDRYYSVHDNSQERTNLTGSMLYERMCCLTRMLKDTGTMFLEGVGGPPGGGWVKEEVINRVHYAKKYRAKIVDYCGQSGLDVEFRTVREIGRSSLLVPLLYTTVAVWQRRSDEGPSLRDGAEIELLVARKRRTQHGGRRATRSRPRQSRSPSRQSRGNNSK